MRIIAADDEALALEWLEKSITKAIPYAEVKGFRKACDVIEYAKENVCQIAFLDIEMGKINGIELAQELKRINPLINIIFITGYFKYTGEAWKIHASGYLMKPVTAEKISEEIKYLRNPVETEPGKRLRVQCFGNFEVFYDDKPLKFHRSKTKEMFAYLIDRKGASINTEQFCSVLWDYKDDLTSEKNMFRMLVHDLKKTLKDIGQEEVFITSRNNFSVNIDLIDCDYYNYLKSESELNYSGEYMSQYSWAEIRNFKMND